MEVQEIFGEYCWCQGDLCVGRECRLEWDRKEVDESQNLGCAKVLKEDCCRSLNRLGKLKLGSDGAFKRYFKDTEKDNLCIQTQCNSPLESEKSKGLAWYTIKEKIKSDEAHPASLSEHTQLPKMFDDSFCPEHWYTQKEGKLVGFYTQRERRNKIKHLKHKLSKHRRTCPVNKQFKGRSHAARGKTRIRGKFVKSELAEKYAVDDKVLHQRNKMIDEYVQKRDYQKAVEVLTEY
ncbi:unnamed protein product [Moneuplotes crassus]|uniref:Uncharacterized protein n=1 Tax=Euplotes crassus TaxID=5936 RepID=A0AAD1X802_EUPCR|nr:unnamed protein product [Moneuplotes crassus]